MVVGAAAVVVVVVAGALAKAAPTVAAATVLLSRTASSAAVTSVSDWVGELRGEEPVTLLLILPSKLVLRGEAVCFCVCV